MTAPYLFFIEEQHTSETRYFIKSVYNNMNTLVEASIDDYSKLIQQQMPSEEILMFTSGKDHIVDSIEVIPHNGSGSSLVTVTVPLYSAIPRSFHKGVLVEGPVPEVEAEILISVGMPMGGFKTIASTSTEPKSSIVGQLDYIDPPLKSPSFQAWKPNKNFKQTDNVFKNMENTMYRNDLIEVESPPKSSRTVVVIHASENSTEAFRERASRLVGCFNTKDNIKASVVTLADGKYYRGLTFGGKKSGGKDISDLYKDFTQVIESKEFA